MSYCYFRRVSLDPIVSHHRPLFIYLLSYWLTCIAHLQLSWNGFTRHTIGTLRYWHRPARKTSTKTFSTPSSQEHCVLTPKSTPQSSFNNDISTAEGQSVVHRPYKDWRNRTQWCGMSERSLWWEEWTECECSIQILFIKTNVLCNFTTLWNELL